MCSISGSLPCSATYLKNKGEVDGFTGTPEI